MNCDHATSLYGRCTTCGMTWAEQLAAHPAYRYKVVGIRKGRDRYETTYHRTYTEALRVELWRGTVLIRDYNEPSGWRAVHAVWLT